MKVLWISDFNINNNPGGSQRTDDEIIKEGRKRGHEITCFNLNDRDELIQANTFDLLVSNNLEHLRLRRPEVFQFICQFPNHVRLEHDSCSYLSVEDHKLLYGSAKQSFFLSDYHHRMFVERFGPIFHNVSIITPPINTKKFKVTKSPEERQDKTLYIGFMHFLKGTQNFFSHVLHNPDKQFVVAAWGDPNMENTVRRFPNVEFLGTVSYDYMPVLYNKYKTLYYHPIGFEAFCRAVGEAVLCGIDLEVGDNIGAVHDYNSYGLQEFRKRCDESKNKFWDLVEIKA